MKKRIVIEEKSNKKNRTRLIGNKFLEWLLYMIGYSIILIIMTLVFRAFDLNLDYYGLYALLASIIIYILNETIKPVIFYLTLPITALTMGLFYPIINLIILYLTSLILGSNFDLHGIIMPFVIAVLISFFNLLLEGLIIKPIVRRGKKHE